MDELIQKTKRELQQIQRATWFWILLMLLSSAMGFYHERFEFKVIKAYQIFYFLGVFFLLAFFVERLERNRLARLIQELITKLETEAGKK